MLAPGRTALRRINPGDNVVTCPWHGSKFNVQDGSVVGGPARLPIKTYKTRVRAGQVEVLA
ncbi:MAG: nitrite reductase (NAD(P)H) small subunit [Candidatus Andersenbacteria bacterium]